VGLGQLATGGTGVIRVCLTGAESTGKSMLAPRLAARFGGVVVEEYGRTYAERHGTNFTPEDLRRIAEGHVAARQAIQATRPRLIVEDTDIVVTCAWAEMLFGSRDPVLEAVPASADLYLLFSPEVPWVDDGTRLFGSSKRRARFHALIASGLTRRGIEPVLIGGDWQQRQDATTAAIAALLGTD
jgi:NadR type nicotinamide-nucleotide adenylyltransferase